MVSIYQEDRHSTRVSEELEWLAQKAKLFVSDLTVAEVVNGFYLQAFWGNISISEADHLKMTFESDLMAKVFECFPVSKKSWERMLALTAEHTSTVGNRAADVLHVAIALENGCTHFFSMDQRQRKLAVAEGLSVLPA